MFFFFNNNKEKYLNTSYGQFRKLILQNRTQHILNCFGHRQTRQLRAYVMQLIHKGQKHTLNYCKCLITFTAFITDLHSVLILNCVYFSPIAEPFKTPPQRSHTDSCRANSRVSSRWLDCTVGQGRRFERP